MEKRKQVEADFHNARSLNKRRDSADVFESKYSNKKMYSVTRQHRKVIEDWFRRHARGAVALDFCCGEGGGAIAMSREGAQVFGIDISAESLALAAEAAAVLESPPHFKVMDAENLDFQDNYFDVIYAAGCLHHLDLSKTYKELHRVLKPSGRVLCNEALAHNPVFHLYRKLTPHLRTPWEVPHILRVGDILKARNYFETVTIRYHYLSVLLGVPFRRTRFFGPLLSFLERIDAVLLSIPWLKRMAWQCTFELSGPKGKH